MPGGSETSVKLTLLEDLVKATLMLLTETDHYRASTSYTERSFASVKIGRQSSLQIDLGARTGGQEIQRIASSIILTIGLMKALVFDLFVNS